MRRALLGLILVIVLALLFVWASLLIGESQKPAPEVKWRTHYVTTEKTVPGPERTVERTVEKTTPGPERTIERTVPCKLPDTSGGDSYGPRPD